MVLFGSSPGWSARGLSLSSTVIPGPSNGVSPASGRGLLVLSDLTAQFGDLGFQRRAALLLLAQRKAQPFEFPRRDAQVALDQPLCADLGNDHEAAKGQQDRHARLLA